MAKGRGSHDAKSAKLVGPSELVAQDLLWDMIMNDVSGIGSCAEKEASECWILGKKLANGLF